MPPGIDKLDEFFITMSHLLIDFSQNLSNTYKLKQVLVYKSLWNCLSFFTNQNEDDTYFAALLYEFR